MKYKLKVYIEKWLPRIALILVVFAPVFELGLEFLKTKALEIKNPYSSSDFYLILIFSVLELINEQIISEREVTGDESNILLNRNQSDYYEIWEVCKKTRIVSIDAYGHSFKTLWFNFIRKFLNEAIINSNHYDKIKIRLVSTKKGFNCFNDIKEFYNNFTPELAKKIEIELAEVNEMAFFTGICVNRDCLWLSIREPHTTNKINEHVREWRRKRNDTSAKMLDWFLGIMDYYLKKNQSVRLTYKQN